MKQITTKQIAEKCGVSRITVDRALNGRAGVSEKKRQEIIDTARKMGYRPHLLAKALVKGKSKSLGIIVFDLSNLFFAQIVNAFQRIAFENGYVTYVMLTQKDPALEKQCIEHLLSRKVDAIVLDSVVKDPIYPDYIRNLGVPVLSILNRIADDIPFLGYDDYRAMYDMTNYVLSKGYLKLLYVCPPLERAMHSNMDSLIRRKEGFEAALHDSAKDVEQQTLGNKQYLQFISGMDFRKQASTAILCTSDIYAVEIHGFLQRKGVLSPHHYGITGFDGIPILHEFEPRITTMSLHIEQLGQKCARMILEHLHNAIALPTDTILQHDILSGQTIV